MAYSDLRYEQHGRVALVTFTRPQALNAFRQQSIVELLDVLSHVEQNNSLRALVLTGEGRSFSSGRDLKEHDALAEVPAVAERVAAVVEQYQNVTRCLTRMDKIVLSAINGVAVGIGAELAAASDIRFASLQARVAFPELRRALFLTNGIVHRLPRIVGLGRATDWILSGRMIDAAEMLASGFVSRVIDDAHLLDEAIAAAAQLGAQAPLSVRLAKEMLNRAFEMDLEGALQAESDALVRCVQSADYREGVQAFIEKRQPHY